MRRSPATSRCSTSRPAARTSVPPLLRDARGGVLDRAHVPRRALPELLEAEATSGRIVVDSRHREEDARLRRFYGELTEEGSPYTKLGRLVEGLFLGPSHYSIGLPCADLVVAATAAAERGGGDARRWLRQLLPRFAVHPATGKLEGVGLKPFPEKVPRPREETRLF